jgi:hypothetical protein
MRVTYDLEIREVCAAAAQDRHQEIHLHLPLMDLVQNDMGYI